MPCHISGKNGHLMRIEWTEVPRNNISFITIYYKIETGMCVNVTYEPVTFIK